MALESSMGNQTNKLKHETGIWWTIEMIEMIAVTTQQKSDFASLYFMGNLPH